MTRTRLAFAGLLALLVAAPALAGGVQSWQPFSPSGGRFRILLPGPPAHRSNTTPTPAGDVVDETWVARSARGSYSVAYTDVPVVGIAFKGGAEGIYAEARKALLDGIRGVATDYSRVRISGRTGRRLSYSAPGDPGQPMLEGRTLLLMVGRRLYVVDAVLPVGDDRHVVEEYLDSFELLSE